ncbi:hypothetical protein [Maribacter litoralis]|uniref:hypothetical protein n=1 Tax=Maribacter litoralis TaxID=2059726 RepID=UPI000E31FB89|nr:hypothetical protein [Maribacter litoralis]
MKKAQVRFNIFNFNPYNSSAKSKDSLTILKEAIQHINDEKTQRQKAIVIDRHDNRQDSESRRLFVSSAAYILKDKVFKFRIALIKDYQNGGVIPKLRALINDALRSFQKSSDTPLNFSGVTVGMLK